MPKIGICKLCLHKKSLQISHAIGNSVFKKILRKHSGKGIEITSDQRHISYSSDSWAEEQLCEDCEKLLNERYEKYGLSVLRAQQGVNFTTPMMGVTFKDINLNIINMYFLSIYWRAANSTHSNYKNVTLTNDDNEYLRKAIYNNNYIQANRFSVKISRFIDNTAVDGFSEQDLKTIIISPFERVYNYKRTVYLPICFVFEGFLIEIFRKGLKLKDRNMRGLIHKTKNMIFVPYLDVFSVSEIYDLMLTGYHKHITGNSKVRQ